METLSPPPPTIPDTPIFGVYHKDGHISLPLTDVLEIYDIACEYTREGWDFIHRKTGKVISSETRQDDNRSPWDSLRRNGLLEPSAFAEKGRIFLQKKRYDTPPKKKS